MLSALIKLVFVLQVYSLTVPTAIAGPTQERFTGGLLGVSADVVLCMRTKHAFIELSGIPLGGSLKGTARFHSGEGSAIVVDEPLNSALKRRFVKIVGARFDRAKDMVYVTVQLPLILGTQTISLFRSQTGKPYC